MSEFVFDGNAGQRRPNDNTFRVFKDDDEPLTLRQGFFIEYLMVGGGGGGGIQGGGGGGGGGVKQGILELKAGPKFPQKYFVEVGDGGLGGNYFNPSKQGEATVFGYDYDTYYKPVLIVSGGGNGGGLPNGRNTADTSGGPGGSGGGGGLNGSAAGGSESDGQGFRGGKSRSGTPEYRFAGGGGGGAGQAGSDAAQNGSTTAGKGGDGLVSSITGFPVIYGGGGGGGAYDGYGQSTAGAGGAGGGGNGLASRGGDKASNGVNGLGGGGGGGASYGQQERETGAGGNGGSGSMIIRYLSLKGRAKGGDREYGDGSASGYMVHTYNQPGRFEFDLTKFDRDNSFETYFTGEIIGDGDVIFKGPGRLRLESPNPSFTGTFTPLDGEVWISDKNALSEATLNLEADKQSRYLNFYGLNLGGLSGGGKLTNNGPLSIGGNNQKSRFDGKLMGDLSITKIGSETLRLTGDNDYDGETNVTQGRVVISGNQKKSKGSVTVSSGASLGGGGVVGGSTTIQAGGVHAPGERRDTIQEFARGLKYESGSTLEWELDVNGAGYYDDKGRPAKDYESIKVYGDPLIIEGGANASLIFNSPGSKVNFEDNFWWQNSTIGWKIFETSTKPIVPDGTDYGSYGRGGFPITNVSTDSLGNTLTSGSFSWEWDNTGLFLRYDRY